MAENWQKMTEDKTMQKPTDFTRPISPQEQRVQEINEQNRKEDKYPRDITDINEQIENAMGG